MPDQDYASFIQNETGIVAPKGNFVNTKGEILGTHEGITHYTVGQRRGLGASDGTPRVRTGNPSGDERGCGRRK